MTVLDLHIHSNYSLDTLAKPEKILHAAKRKGLDGVAITDHNTIKGGLEIERIARELGMIGIAGVEVYTDSGDIIGLFVNEEIESRDSLSVIDFIHSQGGIAILPHPFRKHDLNDELLKRIDLIEVFNARSDALQNEKALELAKKLGKPGISGSDAHFYSEVGACSVSTSTSNIMKCLLSGDFTLKTSYIPPHRESFSQMIRMFKEHTPLGAFPYAGQAMLRMITRKY